NFEGVAGVNGYPPDTNGSAGNDQYVETVNTRYQVWSLNRTTHTATSVLGPSSINTLWAGFGGACQSQNSGDPVVLYDKVANRWLISQFTSAVSGGFYYQCVAVSTTANAAGTYARYAFGRRPRHLRLGAWRRNVSLSHEGGFHHSGKHCPHASSDHACRPRQCRLWRR